MKSIIIYDMHGAEDFIKNPMLVFDALRLERTLYVFEMEDIQVGLFSLVSHPEEYAKNEYVQKLLEGHLEQFPVVFVDDIVKLEGRYPTREEFAQWSGLALEDMPQDPPVSEVASFLGMITGGGCSTPGACSTCSGGCGYTSEEDLDFNDIEF